MITKTIYHGGLMRCCLQTLAEYEGSEDVGTTIGCKFHKDPNEPVMTVTARGWEWIGYEAATKIANDKESSKVVESQAQEVRLGTLLVNDRTLTVWRRYYNNMRTAIQLEDEDGELYATLSVNLPHMPAPDSEYFWVKTWSENEPLCQPALASGLFEDTGTRTESNFVKVQLWRIKTNPVQEARAGLIPESDFVGNRLFIPNNEYGIAEGYYNNQQLVSLLRKHKNEPKTIQFIADMME